MLKGGGKTVKIGEEILVRREMVGGRLVVHICKENMRKRGIMIMCKEKEQE